ncbi:sugar ABC transporter substrate-binding protein [Saccharibacillus alkalitolerans]|uniref:Sugar ABC transporter substrate-binding protein n=1 Tax=Saccharibacillus alkalitolerans TaxID=2705290 RepID=A0ABX0F207_9BACL|nr:substrate-binding domain-containing protein [Saccharibacillus alkalitolerans]NGZ75023.1 sugar ABC transporter substrate-binding protein [Saccharibacillus alkalitolerans]
MHKTISLALGSICAIFLFFTMISAIRFMQSAWQPPQTQEESDERYRLVLITQDLGTPFWNKVGEGAEEEAERLDVNLEVWGTYGEDREDFLKQLEIAIDSGVDGIIVQGMDEDAFDNLTKVKAAFYGIPVITVASDVPMSESMRKTYVGSDALAAGKMIANRLIADMGEEGVVVIMGDDREEYDQRRRLEGIRSVLDDYPGIRVEYTVTSDEGEEIAAATQEVMNLSPDVSAFVSVDANLTAAMVREIGRRSQLKPYHIYSFDDHPDILPLLRQGKLDAVVEQSPSEMGEIGVRMMVRWLDGDTVPLDAEGYPTDIRLLTTEDAQ